MKNLKFSFALLIAILAVGFTVASKASTLNGKRITGCFSGIQVQNESGTLDATPVYNSTSCDDAKALLSLSIPDANRLKYIKALASPVDRTSDICEDVADFCCFQIQEITNPQDFPDVPTVNFGDGAKKYLVTGVLCRP